MDRWAKCDYVTTVSLDRCVDPYVVVKYKARRYVKAKVTQADLQAIERCGRWVSTLRYTCPRSQRQPRSQTSLLAPMPLKLYNDDVRG